MRGLPLAIDPKAIAKSSGPTDAEGFWHHTAKASAEGPSIKEKVGIVTATFESPRVEADVEVGAKGVGLGVDATVFKIDVDFGKTVGITAGLSAESRVGVNADGARLMLVGTGVEFSKTKGTRLCFLGSCLWFNL